MGASLQIEKVSVAYGNYQAVRDASCQLDSGRTLVMLGPSGCGKTSLLNAIAGFVGIQSGAIRVAGRDVAQLPVRKRQIGMVFQSHALFPHLTVADNIAFGLQLRRLAATEISKRVDDACKLVQLQGFGERYPRFLSGGQQQRVALARSLVLNPDVLLLDEPLSSLDAKLRLQMRIELRELQEATGVTMVYVTHDQEEAFALGDLVAVMNQGRIVQLGTPKDIYELPAEAFVASFVGNANLLPVEVAQDGGTDLCRVRLPSGEILSCRNPHGLAAGTKAVIVVRPPVISIAASGDAKGDASNILPAELRLARFMGDLTEVVCQHPLGEIRVTLGAASHASAPELRSGSNIYVSWSPQHCIVVPERVRS